MIFAMPGVKDNNEECKRLTKGPTELGLGDDIPASSYRPCMTTCTPI